MTKGYLRLGIIVFLIAWGTAIGLAHQSICIDLDFRQDIGGYLRRAELATTAESMIVFLDSAIEGLENHGLAEGNWAWITDRNPTTDMGISIGQLENLKERLRVLAIQENKNISSIAYAMSLEEIQESLDEINCSPYSLYTKKHASYLYPEIFISLMLLLGIGGFVIGMILWDIYLIKGSWICSLRGHKWSANETCEGRNGRYKTTGWICHRCDKERRVGNKKPRD